MRDEIRDSLPLKLKELVANKAYKCDNIGMSGSKILIFEDMVLKIEHKAKHFEKSIELLKWLEGKLPVPKVIYAECVCDTSYLLMSRIQGIMACDEYYLKHPDELVTIVAEALKMLWSVDISDCPRVKSLDDELKELEYRVENNLVDIDDVEPETFGEGGFQNPRELLKWLQENKPDVEPCFTHGDMCLPNFFVEDGRVSGYIDLGDAGVGDKWDDIALAYRSLRHNFDGTFGEVYEGLKPELLFEKLGIEPNWEKLRYYILLDELF